MNKNENINVQLSQTFEQNTKRSYKNERKKHIENLINYIKKIENGNNKHWNKS